MSVQYWEIIPVTKSCAWHSDARWKSSERGVMGVELLKIGRQSAVKASRHCQESWEKWLQTVKLDRNVYMFQARKYFNMVDNMTVNLNVRSELGVIHESESEILERLNAEIINLTQNDEGIYDKDVEKDYKPKQR